LLTVISVSGIMGGGVFAYFSDTETSTGNTFTAGTLELTYNMTATCSDAGKVAVSIPAGNGNDSNGINTQVTFSNLVPGDSGVITWTITNLGNQPGMLNVLGRRINDYDGTNTETEMAAEGTGITGTTPGELDDNMLLDTYYTLNGVMAPHLTGHMTMVHRSYVSLDSLPRTLPAAGVYIIEWDWSIPTTVGNIIQGDTIIVNLEMYLDQIH
jgi:predicted ribosomally synthesized peptide with SipW-like signal peptide